MWRMFVVGSYWMHHLCAKRALVNNPISEIRYVGVDDSGELIYDLGIWEESDYGWPIYSEFDDDFDVWNHMSVQPVWD